MINLTQWLNNFPPQTGVECPGNDNIQVLEFGFQISAATLKAATRYTSL